MTLQTNHIIGDACYLIKMVAVAATFPLSVPFLLLIDMIEDSGSYFWTPPWTKRKMRIERELQHKKEKEEAYKRTYAYRYSQPPYN